MRNNKNSWANKIPSWAWVILSFVAALVVWYLLSILPREELSRVSDKVLDAHYLGTSGNQ